MYSNVACVLFAFFVWSPVTARRLAPPQLDSEARSLRSSLDAVGGDSDEHVALTSVNRSSANPFKSIVRNIFNKRDKSKHEDTHVGEAKCGVTVQVTSKDNKASECPSECPFYAQDRTDDLHCTFVCVEASQCAAQNPNKPIADTKLGACRAPVVLHCGEYNLDGTDSCKKCQSLYALGEDGECYFEYPFALYTLIVVFVVIVVFLVVWVVDMIVRPVTNEVGLKAGHDFRSCAKLRQPEGQDGGRRKLWPLIANLMRMNVAGPGMMLHFNFQAAIIVWAFGVALLWCAFAVFVDDALWTLGTRRFGTPRENCILVAWGYETQQRLMWTKVLFLLIVYIVTFILSLLFGVRQLRLFQLFDFDNKTSKDFVAYLKGLPCVKGNEKMEEELQKELSSATGQTVLGVSVCWNFKADQEEVTTYLEKHLDNREKLRSPRKHQPPAATEVPDMNPVRTQLYALESTIFGPDEDDGKTEEEYDREFKDKLAEMSSSHYAFAVFETETARDLAIEKSKEVEFTFKGAPVQLMVNDCEPDTVQWKHFDNSSGLHKFFRLMHGMFYIFLGLVFWTVVFYAPYAWSVFHFNYDNGAEPGFIYGLSFSMIVCVGNVIMYEICNRVSDYVGFKFNDQREACYTVLYCIACMFNVLMDMFTTYVIALKVMEGLGFRTYQGERLENIHEFHEQFDTYAMQRSLAGNTYAYAFPSTFLIPFLIEPFATIYLPWQLGVWVVRSHPEITGRAAEALLMPAPMDMGRYADILLDVILGILIFYFPGGYTYSLFFYMSLCHIYIYMFDHWKVLRGIPAVSYASMDVDWAAQAMMAPCCGLILSCLVFKGNCQGYGYCIGGAKLIEVCTLTCLVHCAVHLLLLKYLVPVFGRKEPENEELENITYQDFASKLPCSFFSSNPIHCLRSHLVYGHSPSCSFHEVGKEHLMDANEKICCYFKTELDAGSEDEELSFEGAKTLWKSIRGS